MGRNGWQSSRKLDRRYVDEEEDEHFPQFEDYLTGGDRAWMRSVG